MFEPDAFRTGAKSTWGWRPVRDEGIWRHGCAWARPLVACAPWATLALLLVEFAFLRGTFVAASGVTFDLPAAALGETDVPGLVALVTESVRGDVRETLVFFDDARYRFDDDAGADALARVLEEKASASHAASLLVVADRRVASGALMKLVALARRSGVRRVQVAERRE